MLGLKAAGLADSGDIARLLVTPVAARRTLRRTLSDGLRRGSAREASWQCALQARSDVELGLRNASGSSSPGKPKEYRERSVQSDQILVIQFSNAFSQSGFRHGGNFVNHQS